MMRGEMDMGARSPAPDFSGAGRLLTGLELLLRALTLLRPAPRNAAGIRVLRDPKHQVVEPNAEVSRLLWREQCDEDRADRVACGINLAARCDRTIAMADGRIVT